MSALWINNILIDSTCTTQDDNYLLQRSYEFILFPNYFITIVYYYHTHPIMFFYFFSIPTFLHLKIFFVTGFFCLYVMYNFISDSILYFYLQCTLRYSLDSTIVGSKTTLIMCSFLVQRNYLKQQLAALLPC